jgi:preprotein translocase subunit YajC
MKVFSLVSLALQQASGGGGGGAGMFGSPIIMMVLMFGVVYLMMIRPQQKKAREHQEWLRSLKKGDEVVTQGGVIGRISGLTDQFVTLEVQEKVRIKVLRSSVTGKPPEIKKAAPVVDEKAQPAEEKK